MNNNNPMRFLIRFVAHAIRRAFVSQPAALPPAEQLTLDFDQITEAGLPLRDALPVRSAEYWLRLGQPDLALKELETLPETVRQQQWALRVQLAARHALNTLVA